MRQLSPLRARLTAVEPEWVLTGTAACFALRTSPIASTDLGGRSRQAVGGDVCGAVSDHHDVQAPMQPARLRPGRMTPIGAQRLVVDAAVLREPTDNVPPIVVNPLEQGLGRRPGSEEDRLRTTTQPLAGLAEPRKGQGLLRSPARAPEAQPERNAQRAIHPDQPDAGETIHGRALLTGLPPGHALDSRRQGLGNPVSSRLSEPRSQ